jgi:hypothetical protein
MYQVTEIGTGMVLESFTKKAAAVKFAKACNRDCGYRGYEIRYVVNA